MKRILFIAFMLCMVVTVWPQTFTDPRCISLMGIPLEGADSVFVPALKAEGFEPLPPESDDPCSYYFKGDFYGIKDATLIATVNEKTRLLSEVSVTCGPYCTRELFDRNQKYLLTKLQREWDNFKPKGDGSLYYINDYGYIQQRQVLHDDGRHSISYYYLNMSPYYKDAANMGLKGQVQEVITDNPVMEGDINHFEETGQLVDDQLIDREYSATGYLVKAAMKEPSGGKSLLSYEYDSDYCLTKRTLYNPETGIRSVNEYHYNTSFEIIQQSQKVFNKDNECVLSINMRNDLSERDDNGNWTKNKMHLTYWEKGQRTQVMQVEQTRTISYWDE